MSDETPYTNKIGSTIKLSSSEECIAISNISHPVSGI